MARFVLLLCLAFVLAPWALAQKDTVDVPSDLTGEGSLNNAVQEKVTAGTLSNTVFRLEPYGYYILNGKIEVPQGQHLEITAPDPGTTQLTSPPQIVWTASSGVDKAFIFECYGDITLRNVWLRYADVGGAQVGSCIQIVDDPAANASGKGERAFFENVQFDYSPSPPNAAGAVSVTAKRFKGTFKNCYFKNCIDTHLRYYGRAVSFPYQTTDWHIDSLYFENCTFANLGYVYMQEGGEYGDNVHFNHCTFLNIVMFSLESGWWYKMSVTNSLFVNAFMYGDIPAQTGTGDPNGATIRIDSISTFPHDSLITWTEQDRRILFANNAYFMEPWLVDWMRNNPYSQFLHQNRRDDEIPVPQPMLSPATLRFFDTTDGGGQKIFPYMNRANLHEGVDPGFVLAPTNMDSLKDFMRRKWDDNTDANWSFMREDGLNQLWPVREDLSYSNTTLASAGMGGYPLGDLYRWWPAKYPDWKAQANLERQYIASWLETGVPTSVTREPGLPEEYALHQNFPNPFNPTTTIGYSIPRGGKVSLKVYDALGRDVATLVSGEQAAGNYTVDFHGQDLSSGVYFYRLQAGDVSMTKKLVLMK